MKTRLPALSCHSSLSIRRSCSHCGKQMFCSSLGAPIVSVIVLLMCSNTIFFVQCDDSSVEERCFRKPDATCAKNFEIPFLAAVSEFKHVQTEQLMLSAANNHSARLLVYTIGCGEMSNHLLVRPVLSCLMLYHLVLLDVTRVF